MAERKDEEATKEDKRTDKGIETGQLYQQFFLAHAVRARGSDGHQNVLWFSGSIQPKKRD